MNKSILGVIGGGGHIGLIHAACLSSLGYNTVAYDRDVSKIKILENGDMPFFEPGLDELVRRSLADGRLSFTRHLSSLREAGMVYICVGTPALSDGLADTLQVESTVEELASVASGPVIAVIKSTVPVGTARKLNKRLAELGVSRKVTVVSNPEFLAEGSGIKDFMQPSRIIAGGENQAAVEKVAAIHKPPGVPVILTSWENAELIKHASNALLAAKISFINEMASLSGSVGGDIRIVSRGVGMDPRIGPHFLEAGVGFSGPCLEKDLCSLICQFNAAEEDSPLLEAVLLINQRSRYNLVHKLKEILGSLEGKEIGVLGLAFKAGTDDLRDSHSIPIIEHLLSHGAVVTVHDPMAGASRQKEHFSEQFPEVFWALSPYDATEGKDALLILTAWPEYKELDPQKLKRCLANPVIVDGRNLFEPAQMKALKIKYVGVGM